MKDNRTYKSGAKSIIMNNNCSLDLNRSMTNSIITSSYIILKDGTKKRKRHMNSYMEEFLEKRRMAAEFAQSKRSTSSKNPKVRVGKNMNSSNDCKYNINIKKIEEAISINNLKNNLPGKTKALIDNTNLQNNNDIMEKNETDNKANMLFQENSNKYSKYINVSNKEEVNKESDTKSLIINNQNINNNFYINEQNNYNISNANTNTDKDYLEKKYNNVQRHNIVYTKKKENINNKNLSNHSFTENRYSSMYQDNDIDEQCNMGNMELLGPQLPEEAFLGNDKNNNNNKYTVSKDININYENNIQNTDKKSLSKDIKDNKNFKDISPIKPNINIQSQNNSGKIYSLNEEDADIDIDNVNIKKVNRSDHFMSLMQRMINKNSTNENDLYALNLKKNELQEENIKNDSINNLDKQNENKNEIVSNKKIEFLNYNNEQNINVNIENNINIKNIKNIEYKKFINKTEELKVEDNMMDTQKKDEQNNNSYQEKFNQKEKNVKNIILNEDNLNNSDENELIDPKNIKNDKNNLNNNENNFEISQNKEKIINNEKMIEDNKNKTDKEYENNNAMNIKENENMNNNIQNKQNKDTFDIIDNEKDEKSNNALLKSDKLTKNKMNLMNSEEQKFLEEYVVEENEENNVVIRKEDEENDEQEKSINKQDEEKNENYNDEEENDDIERCEVLKGDELRDKSKYLKGKNNIITEEIEEVEEAQEANENTSEFANSKSNRKHIYTPMIITQNNFEIKNNSNKDNVKNKIDVKAFSISNQNIFIPQQKENKNEEKDNKNVEDYIVNEKRNIDVKKIINDDSIKYNNLSKVEIIDFKSNKSEQIYYKKNINYIDKNKLNEQNNENEKINIGNDMNIDMISNSNIIKYTNTENIYNINNYQNVDNKEIYKSKSIDIFNNINNFKKDAKEEENQNKTNILYNDDNTNDMNNINKINNITNNNINVNTDISNNDNNDNYINNNYINNTVNNIEKERQMNNKEKEEFLKVINQDIERLEKIRNNNIPQETKEEDSYMYEIDNFINLMKEKRKSTESNAIKELMDNKDEYNSQLKYNFYEIKKNLNVNNDYSNINDISSDNNKVKLNINKSSRLQALLNNLKKEKIKDKFKYDMFNNNDDYNKENMGEISYNIYNEKNNEIEDENNDIDGRKKDKLFDETMFRKIKERNFNNKNNYRKEFQLKDYGTNKNHSHVYLDKVKEDLMNISSTKIMSKNELNQKRIPMSRLVYSNANNNDNDIEIMPANNMSSLYKKNYK